MDRVTLVQFTGGGGRNPVILPEPGGGCGIEVVLDGGGGMPPIPGGNGILDILCGGRGGGMLEIWGAIGGGWINELLVFWALGAS